MIAAWRAMRAALVGGLYFLIAGQAWAEQLRIATYNVELTRGGPGLLLRDLRARGDPQIQAILDVLVTTRPDILALQGIDYDYGQEALNTLQARMNDAGADLPYALALPTNRGLRTGLDMDGDGQTGRATDAQGFGAFYGQGAMAVLSRYPILVDQVRDFTDMLWTDLPGATLPRHPDGTPFPSSQAQLTQRLSSSGHWVVPVALPNGAVMSVMTFHASPPVFDGPEDRNGLRNADEIRFWKVLLDGDLGPAPQPPFVIAGAATLDPADSDGRHATISALLSDPRLIDPMPVSPGGAEMPDQGHTGDNALDTVDWGSAGRLRVSYVLPSANLSVLNSGVFWPKDGAEHHSSAIRASRHRLVWVDVAVPAYVAE